MKSKYLNFILVFILLSFTLSGCNNNENKFVTDSQNPVAELSIFSYDGKSETKYMLKNYGHSFFSLKNISEDTIIVGEYSLLPTESVSFGAWSISSHFGIWYNVESNYIDFCDKYNGRVSISKLISAEDLSAICDFMKDNDIWLPFKNCSYFCINLWNTVAKKGEELHTTFLTSPSYLVGQLKNFDDYKVNKEIITDNYLGYFKDGNFVRHSFKESDIS